MTLNKFYFYICIYNIYNIYNIYMDHNIKILIILILPFIIGYSSFYFTKNSLSKYKYDIKPSWQPPGFVFGIVWIFLYLANSLSAIIAFNKFNKQINVQVIILFFFILQIFIENFWVIYSGLFVNYINKVQLYILIFLNIVILSKIIYFSYIKVPLSVFLSSFEVIWISIAISFIAFRLGYKNSKYT